MANPGKFLGALFGSAAGAAVDPAASVVDGVSKIIGLFKLSPDVKAQLQAQLTAQNVDLEKAELAANLAQVQGQLDANTAEAASANWFIAGWRPAVGWVCVIALFYGYVVQPFTVFALLVFHVQLPANLPSLDSGTLISGLLVPLLGLGLYRTVEKFGDVQGNH